MGTIRHATLTSELNGAKVSATEWDAAHDISLEIADITGLQAALDAKGSGSVTSVAATVPTGFAVTGSPITTTGTLAIAFAPGYNLPSDAVQANWTTAFGWGNHASAGYLTSATAAATYQPIGTYYTPGGTDVAVADGGTGASTASGARTNLAAAAQSQAAEQISGFIASPSNKDYRIALDMKHGGTITEVTTRSASGTCTATWKINTTALGGTANSVSSTETTQTHSSANVFAAGDDIVLTVSANSSCADMSFTIKYTRTLA